MARILVFDDSKMFRDIVCSLLHDTSEEIEAVCPTSLFDALKHLYQNRPALLITDYSMPNLNGESLIRAIREDSNLAGLKVVMLSSHHESDLITRIIQKGVDAYMLKGPALKQELPRRVAEILKG